MGVRNKAQKGPCYALEAVFSPPRVKYIGPLSTAPGDFLPFLMSHLINRVISFTISLQISNEIKSSRSAPPNINRPRPPPNSVEASETFKREKLVKKV